MHRAWFLIKKRSVCRLEVGLLAAHAVEDGGDERKHTDHRCHNGDLLTHASEDARGNGEQQHQDGNKAVAAEAARLVGAVDTHDRAEEGEHGADEVEHTVEVDNEHAEARSAPKSAMAPRAAAPRAARTCNRLTILRALRLVDMIDLLDGAAAPSDV